MYLQVDQKQVKISQEVDDKKKRSFKEIKFPSIPGRSVTFVHQATRPKDGQPDDIVACIYLGYMPRTKRYVHVHVYRFDEASTATAFATRMAAIVNSNQKNIVEVERKLASEGQIEPPQMVNSADMMSERQTTDSAVGSASSGYSDEDLPPNFNRDIDPDLQSLADVQPFESVTDELRHRMKKEASPLLYPPRDYDTLCRKMGNLIQVDIRRCNEEKIVGGFASKERNGSDESGVDMTGPETEDGNIRPSSLFSNAPGPPPPPPAPLPKPGGPIQKDPQSPTDTTGKKLVNGHRRQNSLGTAGGLSQADSVYPPKVDSPVMSPRLYRQAIGNALNQLHRQNSQNEQLGQVPINGDPIRRSLSRQNSSSENLGHVLHRQGSNGSDKSGPFPPPFLRQNSNTSNGSFHLSQQSSDLDRSYEEGKLMYYKGPHSEDLYSMPMKAPHSARHSQPLSGPSSPGAFPPADYYNDDPDAVVEMRRMGRHQYRQPHLTRSMPADLIRSEMVLGSGGSRPGSGEFRQMRRGDSPAFVGGGRTDSPVFLPQQQRVDSPSFMHGPQAFVKGGPRVDSPSFMTASQPYGLAGDGVAQSPRLMRVNSGKR